MLLVLQIAMIIPLSLWRGYALATLWVWHVVPVFGIPELSIAHAWGVSVLISLLTYQYIEPNDTERHTVSTTVVAIITPAIALFSGWLATWFI